MNASRILARLDDADFDMCLSDRHQLILAISSVASSD